MIEESQTDAAALRAILTDNENWLIDRVLYYAKRQGYTQYTSTLREAWRQSIAGLSGPLTDALEKGMSDVELTPDEDYAADPLARFAITEANRHLARGVDLGMFLGLMKYYRQSYMDLVGRRSPDPAHQQRFSLTLNRFFDRMEIGLVTAWNAQDQKDPMADLRQANRSITNEKNKYLTFFDSLQSPVAILDENNCIDAINHAWATLFGGAGVPGTDDYDETRVNQPVAWLSAEIDRFIANRKAEETMEKVVETAKGSLHLSIKIKRMLDVSEKFMGCVIILDDVTGQKQAESALKKTTRNSERLKGALELAGAVCHDMNQPLMAITGYAELALMDCPEDAPYRRKLVKIVEHVASVGAITKKLMHVTRYETKSYLDQQIIDIDKSSSRS